MSKTTIQIAGHGPVDCYGTWDPESSNAACTFEDEFLDGIYADGGANWTEVARTLAEYAQRNGTVLLQLEEC